MEGDALGGAAVIYTIWAALPGQCQAIILAAFIPFFIISSEVMMYGTYGDYFNVNEFTQGYCNPANYTSNAFEGSQIEDISTLGTIWQTEPVMAIAVVVVGLFILYKMIWGPISGCRRACKKGAYNEDSNAANDATADELPEIMPPLSASGESSDDSEQKNKEVKETCFNTVVIAEKHAHFFGSWPKKTLKLSTRDDDEDALPFNKRLSCILIWLAILVEFCNDILTPLVCLLTCYTFVRQLLTYGDCNMGRDTGIKGLVVIQGNYVITLVCLLAIPYACILLVNIHDWILVKCMSRKEKAMKNRYLNSFNIETPGNECLQRVKYEMQTGWMTYCKSIVVDTVGLLLLPLSENSSLTIAENGCISGFQSFVCKYAFLVNLSTWFARAVPALCIIISLRMFFSLVDSCICQLCRLLCCLLDLILCSWYYILRCLYETICLCGVCITKQKERIEEAREQHRIEREERIEAAKLKTKQFECCMAILMILFASLCFAAILILAYLLGYSNVMLGLTDENGKVNFIYVLNWKVDFPDFRINLSNFRFPIVWILLVKVVNIFKLLTTRVCYSCLDDTSEQDMKNSVRRKSEKLVDGIAKEDIKVTVTNTVDTILEKGEAVQESMENIELVKTRTDQAIIASHVLKSNEGTDQKNEDVKTVEEKNDSNTKDKPKEALI